MGLNWGVGGNVCEEGCVCGCGGVAAIVGHGGGFVMVHGVMVAWLRDMVNIMMVTVQGA